MILSSLARVRLRREADVTVSSVASDGQIGKRIEPRMDTTGCALTSVVDDGTVIGVRVART